jgi:magnesium transporter
MKKKIKDKSLKTMPGSLQYVGKVVKHDIELKMVEYNNEYYASHIIDHDFSKITLDKHDEIKTWINIDGIHQPDVIQEIGNIFGLHPLLMEDILNTNQKPKIEYYGDSILYFTLKAIKYNPFTKVIEGEHVSLVLGHDFLLTFQEEGMGDIFKDIYTRVENAAGRIRKYGVDYLLFSIIDLIVDNYLEVIQLLDDDMDILEDDIINNPKERNQNLLYGIKREINYMRKVAFPIKEMLNTLVVFNENELINENTKLYFRDAHDHASQVIEMLDSNREMVASLLDLYHSQMSNKMNNVIKILTIISVIFMPLTFIVGVYGMNFDFMPELHWKYGYPTVWAFVIIITLFMLIYFRKKKWL